MANPFDIPLNPSGAGTVFGWTGPSKKDLEAQNQARMAMKLAYDAGMPEDQILAQWGRQAGLGDTGAIQEASRGRSEALGRYVSQTMPSTRLEGQSQPGPVLQEPSFDIMSQLDRQQEPGIFEMMPGTQDIPYHPDRAERMGRPAGDFFSPGQQLDLSGERAATLEGIPRQGTIPEYLRAPSSLEASPSVYDPGGERVEQPGLSMADIISRDPEAAALLLRGDLDKYYRTEKEASSSQDEAASAKATQKFMQEVNAGGDQDEALDKYETQMSRGRRGRDVLAQVGKGLERQKTSLALKKTNQATKYLLDQAAQLKASEDPEDQVLGAQLEALAHSKEAAEVMVKHQESLRKKEESAARLEESQAKRMEAKRPTVIDDVPYVWGKNEAGESVLQVAPGFVVSKDVKPWWNKLTEPQIAAVANDSKQEPKVREEARATLADLAKQKKAGAASTTIKLPAGERKDWAETLASLDVIDRIDSRLEAQKKNIGGPFGIKAKINTVFMQAGWGPKEFAEFRSDVQRLRAKLSHDLAGANVPVGERRLYLADLPDIDNDSTEQFLAKYHNLKTNMTNFAHYLRRLDQGETDIPIPEPASGRRKPSKKDPLDLFDPNDPRR
jgi:hypothetical protein